MPQFQPVTIKDGQNPPVAHSFKPREISGGVATLIESTGVPIGDRRITMSVNRTSTGRVKLVMKFTFPVVDNAVVNGVARATVLRTNYAEVNFNFDSTSTAAERADVASLVNNFFLGANNPMIGGVVVDLEGIY